MEDKNLDPKLWILVMLIVALIGCLSTIVGAAIGILPDIMKLLFPPPPVTQPTSPPPTSSDIGRSTTHPSTSLGSQPTAISKLTTTPWHTPHFPHNLIGLPAPTVERVTLEGTWTVFTTGFSVNDLVFHDNLLWATTSDGILVWDAEHGTYTRITVPGDTHNEAVGAMTVGSDNAFWFATGKGTSRYDSMSHTWQSFTYWEGGPADDSVSSIIVGPDSALWFGTWNGVSRYDPVTHIWRSFTKDDGLVNNRVRAIAVGLDGCLWFGTLGGISRYDLKSGTWHSYTRLDVLLDDQVEALAIGPDGILWVAYAYEKFGITRYNPLTDRWQDLWRIGGKDISGIEALTVGPDGNVWLGTFSLISLKSDLRRYKPETDSLQIFDIESVSALEISSDGVVWIGTGNAVIRFKPSQP